MTDIHSGDEGFITLGAKLSLELRADAERLLLVAGWKPPGTPVGYTAADMERRIHAAVTKARQVALDDARRAVETAQLENDGGWIGKERLMRLIEELTEDETPNPEEIQR